jgi:dihydroorotase
MSSPAAPPRLACRPMPPERLLLPGVHLFDPAKGLDSVGDLLVADGRIEALHEPSRRSAGVSEGTVVLEELRGCHVFPGFVDIHTHLRTPGYEYKEDLASGSAAAAAGGYVAAIAMANTSPVVDKGPLAAWVLDEAARESHVLVGQVGAVSRGLAGEELAELRELADTGVAGFSDDGRPVNDSDLLLHALRYLRGTERPVMLHLEDRTLSADGVMHEGRWSARLGLKGIPAAAEAGPMARDLELLRHVRREARAAGREAGETPLHFQHLSVAASIRLLRAAKVEGLPVTAEATPHHLLLTDETVRSHDPNLKVNPPLRSAEDREALVSALAEGLIDCVATDHAPHAPQEKEEVPFEEAAFGTTGLETAFAALYGGLVVSGRVSLARLVDAMSTGPCRCLRLAPPRLEVGAPAHFCVVDLDEEWMVTTGDLKGKSRNCAFIGERVRGRVLLTVVHGARRFSRARRTAPEHGAGLAAGAAGKGNTDV